MQAHIQRDGLKVKKAGFIPLSAIIGTLLILGLYYPTDIAEHLTFLSLSGYLVCLALLAALTIGRPGRPSAPVSIVLLSIVPLLLVFTGTSGLPTLRLGALAPYGLLSVLYLIDIRNILLPRWVERLWLVFNIINIVVGAAIVLGFQPVDDFIIAHYSMAYDELLPNMLAWRKPVLTFASHSLAAFFLYLFFWINLEAYKVKRQKLFMTFSVCYLFLILCLLSVSGLVLGTVGVLQLLFFVWSSIRRKFVAATVLCIFPVLAAFVGSKIHWREPLDVAKEILQNPGNGLMGRFLPGGTMYYDIIYLKGHPFSPVGTSYRTDFMFGDCGPVEYLLRGSLPFLLLVYGGFYYFLRRNLISKWHAYFLFAAFLAFESGISTLVYFRTFYLLPVFVVYLNSLQRGPPRVLSPGEP
jgi:hypothetical protein